MCEQCNLYKKIILDWYYADINLRMGQYIAPGTEQYLESKLLAAKRQLKETAKNIIALEEINADSKAD